MTPPATASSPSPCHNPHLSGTGNLACALSNCDETTNCLRDSRAFGPRAARARGMDGELRKSPHERTLDTAVAVNNHGNMVQKTAGVAQSKALPRAGTRSTAPQADSHGNLVFRLTAAIRHCGARPYISGDRAFRMHKRSVTPCRSNPRVTCSKQSQKALAKCHTFQEGPVRVARPEFVDKVARLKAAATKATLEASR